MSEIEQTYITGSVTSNDGTAIGYRKFGEGSSLVLLHGNLSAAQHLMNLGRALAGSYTVYIPDRRGRGASAPIGSGYCLEREVEDLTSMLYKSRAQLVFGAGTGALVVLRALLSYSGLRKAALYEPALDVDGALLEGLAPVMRRYDREIAKGNLALALTTVLKGSGMMPDTMFSKLPEFLLARSFRQAMQEEKEATLGSDVALETLIPTQGAEYKLMVEAKGSLASYRSVQAEVLLLSGSRSPSVYHDSILGLESVLRHSRRVEIKGMNHAGPAAHGAGVSPLAEALTSFFGTRTQ